MFALKVGYQPKSFRSRVIKREMEGKMWLYPVWQVEGLYHCHIVELPPTAVCPSIPCICHKSHACNVQYYPFPSQHSRPRVRELHLYSFGRWQIRQPCSVPGMPLAPLYEKPAGQRNPIRFRDGIAAGHICISTELRISRRSLMQMRAIAVHILKLKLGC